MSESTHVPLDKTQIAIIGLGYVGLPLAIAFATKYRVLGFDKNPLRIQELKKGYDRTREADLGLLNSVLNDKGSSTGLTLSHEEVDLQSFNTYIVTVPTPVNQFKAPDLTFLIEASEMIGRVLKINDLIIYEST